MSQARSLIKILTCDLMSFNVEKATFLVAFFVILYFFKIAF
jgi:hypothetical protein